MDPGSEEEREKTPDVLTESLILLVDDNTLSFDAELLGQVLGVEEDVECPASASTLSPDEG